MDHRGRDADSIDPTRRRPPWPSGMTNRYEVDAAPDPPGELGIASIPGRVHEHGADQGPAGECHRSNVPLAEHSTVRVGSHPDHQGVAGDAGYSSSAVGGWLRSSNAPVSPPDGGFDASKSEFW